MSTQSPARFSFFCNYCASFIPNKAFPGNLLATTYKEVPVALSNLQMKKLRLRVGKGVSPDTSERSKERREEVVASDIRGVT